MSHFAKVVDGNVVDVISAEQDFIDKNPLDIGAWVQTSYNTRGGIHYLPNSDIPSDDQSKALRKNYAGVGYTYDEVHDAFIMPKPFPSWVLNSNLDWVSPVPYPENENRYVWDEDTASWVVFLTPQTQE